MITVGVDAHKQVHEAVALDEVGQEIGRWRGANTSEEWGAFRSWLDELGEERQVGIEGAWGYGRGLAQYLVGGGEVVFDINSRWTAKGRQSARQRGKSDRLDARSVARVVRQEEKLPEVHEEDETTILGLLVSERDDALAECTRLRNQIHELLLQLDPEYKKKLPSLTSKGGLRALLRYRPNRPSAVRQERAAAVRRLGQRLKLATDQAEELKRKIEARAESHFEPLTELCGINLLSAGVLAGILGPGKRFSNDAQLAAYAGIAPLEASSAGLVRHRLNRGGNRRLNATVYLVALTQLRHCERARAYAARRISEGKTKREMRRVLERYIIRAIWRLWQKCMPDQRTQLGVTT